MVKKGTNKYTSGNREADYLILAGTIILLIGFVAAVFAGQVAAGIILEVVGTFISAVGLSKHSLNLLERRAGKI